MTGLRYTLSINDAPVRAALANLDIASQDLTEAFDQIGDVLVAGIIERFDRGVGPDGVPWKPSQRAQKEGGKTLVKSGRGRDSFVHEASPQQLVVGSALVYMAAHHIGAVITQSGRTQTLAFKARGGGFASRSSTRRRKGGAVRVAFSQTYDFSYRLPARPIVGMSDDERDEATRIMGAYLVARARGSAPGGRA